ncbi:hypothetical protein THRCLA_08915 [Thraustotheca clavata]|uniref:Transcription factor CBF/NF-Y/archaeal histone domain-containing protein n=3 Tax=Saprolegniales TaxID=4763 RepID=A0A1V9Z105_9STRA|nr:hypothetical protein THRCLA_08915 [Thraustotheca clavata]
MEDMQQAVNTWAVLSVDANGVKIDSSSHTSLDQHGNDIKYYRYEHHTAEIEVHEALASKLHDNPILTLFLADHSSIKATAEIKQEIHHDGKDAPPVAATGRNFISFFEIDLSPFLHGDMMIETQWGEKTFCRETQLPIHTTFIPAPGLLSLVVRVKVDHCLLPLKQASVLNPLTIHVRKAANLPGITVQSKPLLKYIVPTPHTAFTQCCLPTYISLRFLEHPQRIVRSNGIVQDNSVAWNFKTTFLCGLFKWLVLQESFQSGHVVIEVHDRDIKLEKSYDNLVHKWECLIAGKPHSGEPHNNVKPLDIFQVDEIAKQDIQLVFFQQAGDRNAHGIATYRFYELLNTTNLLKPSTLLASASGTSLSHDVVPFQRLKFTSEVVQQKRRLPPKEGTDDDAEDLSQVERLVRVPGAYLSTNTTLSIDVSIAFPLQKPATEPLKTINGQRKSITNKQALNESTTGLFGRMVLIVAYEDTISVTAVAEAMEKVNSTSLPGAPLRSYQLTPAQKSASDNGELDIITGFQVLDTNYRMFFIEGLANQGMRIVHDVVKRLHPNGTNNYHMFANNEIRFTHRLYTAFDVDLKRIKLRDPLPDIIKRPELYMRSKVSENCFQALNRLQDVRKVNRLNELQDLDLFPLVSMLLEVESKYGESITLDDIHGINSGNKGYNPRRISVDTITAANDMSIEQNDAKEELAAHTGYVRLKALTDATNKAYEQAKQSWQPKNYVEERRREKQAVDEQYATMKAQQPPPSDEPVYNYSGQKLRTKDLEKAAMRERLAKDKHATFTDSENFNSLTWSLVDETKLTLLAENASKALYTTPTGFVYPPPRQPSEFYKHAKAPSAARCEDLQSPWIENLYHPQPLERDSVEITNKAPFDSLPSKDMIFGGTNADMTLNPEYFKSVHLVGDGLAKEMEEAKAKEHQEWLDKLVVDQDNLRFIAHGNIMGQGRVKPSALDKPRDILEGAPKSKPIRIVRNAKLPSGKPVPLVAAPVSIMCSDTYKGGVNAQILRDVDTNQFLSHKEDGRPKDFLFPSVTDILVPEVNRHTTIIKPRRELSSRERAGLIWKNITSSNNQQMNSQHKKCPVAGGHRHISAMEEQGQVVQLTQEEHAAHMAQMEAQLKVFWAGQLAEMEKLEVGSEQDFKNHNDLPLARIKRIMKSDEDVRMISAEAPVLFAKACEMFILELTLRSWGYSEKNKRRTLQKEDIQTAIRNTDIFDFLVDVIN